MFNDSHRAFQSRLIGMLSRLDGSALARANTIVPTLAKLELLPLLAPIARDSSSELSPGSSGIDLRAICLAREALAYLSPLADGIFAVQGLSIHPLILARSAVHDASVARAVAGEAVGAFALTEPEAGSDVASIRATAVREGDRWVLSGEKVFISNATIADFFVVFAKTQPDAGKAGISAFLVPKSSPGLIVEEMPTSDGHPLGRVTLQRSSVAHDALIGGEGEGMRLAMQTLDAFRTSVGAAAVGMAARAFDEAVAHVTTRVQFGKPLAQFQLTQGALAEMMTEMEAARMMVYRAAWMKDTSVASSADVAMAKLFATEAAQRVVDRAVQLHGGLGVVGSVVERLYSSVRPLRIYEGTSEIQKLIIGAAIVREHSADRS